MFEILQKRHLNCKPMMTQRHITWGSRGIHTNSWQKKETPTVHKFEIDGMDMGLSEGRVPQISWLITIFLLAIAFLAVFRGRMMSPIFRHTHMNG
jgi:hypothetical protein